MPINNVPMDPATIGLMMQDAFNAMSRASFDLSSNSPYWHDQAFTAPIVLKAFAAPSWLVPFHVRSGPRKVSDDGRRKWIRGLVFFRVGIGAGSLKVRVWVDGKLACVGIVEMDETPLRARKMPLPRGVCGYTVDVEVVGTVPLRHTEVEWEDMEWEE